MYQVPALVRATMRVQLTLKSKNVKTSPIPVSSTHESSCPECALKGNGCYGDDYYTRMLWNKVNSGSMGGTWDQFVAAIYKFKPNQLWRMNQIGDLPGLHNDIDSELLFEVVEANKGRRGFTYTHKPMNIESNRNAVKHANQNGFTINLSGNNANHADDLYDLGIAPVVCVLPTEQVTNTTTPKGRKIVVCPAAIREDVTCKTCGLCAIASRKVIVGFPAHGTRKNAADSVAKQESSNV